MIEIQALLNEAERWLAYHKGRGKTGMIEAAACEIRIKALKDALEAIKKRPG